jgi:L-fuconolactonase
VFEKDLQRLAEQKMTLDVLGGANLLANVARVAKLAPNLRLVIDHLPFNVWDNDLVAMRKALTEVAAMPKVYAKVSNVVRRIDGRIIEAADAYRARLDLLAELFGADRLLYGSNWPVSERVAPYDVVHNVVAEYFNAKGRTAAEKFFWKNSRTAYGWQPRGAAKNLIS